MDEELKPGDLVIVLGSLKTVRNDLPNNSLIVGTYLGLLGSHRVQVLLSTGVIFTGLRREVASYASQKEG